MLLKRIIHALTKRHYGTIRGSVVPIDEVFWIMEIQGVISVGCVICHKAVERPEL